MKLFSICMILAFLAMAAAVTFQFLDLQGLFGI